MIYTLITAQSPKTLEEKIAGYKESWHPAGYGTRVIAQGTPDTRPDISNRSVFNAIASTQIRTVPTYVYWAILSRASSCD